MSAARHRRRALAVSAALLAGAALFFALKSRTEHPAASAERSEIAIRQPPVAPGGNPAPTAPARPVPPVRIEEASGLSTSEIALKLGGWPEGLIHPDLPQWAAILAARGPAAVTDISSALATAESNTARGVLSDALARIGTDNAIQELCSQAALAPDGTSGATIAGAFRALGRPAAVPMLATLLAATDSPVLVREASDAIRRLADQGGVDALTDLAREPGQLHSQRDAVLGILSALENPEAMPALTILSADETDPELAAAARKGMDHLKASAGTR